MYTLLIALGSFVGFFIAYHTYGRFLARKIFRLDPEADVPSRALQDDIDYVPTRKSIIFGHHFTSIAGTGPIVGPAIAVFWGWLPALLWVVFGCIFIGAVHDFGAVVISMRNQGKTVGEITGHMISNRARILFLFILFFALTLVIAIFGLIIAAIFQLYPESVLSVWVAMPVAIGIGFWVRRRGSSILVPSLLALGVLYLAIYVGIYYLPGQSPIEMGAWCAQSASNLFRAEPLQLTLPEQTGYLSPIVQWTILLLVYCYIASVLPVWMLLQPRDYVNSHQLFVALALLVAGIVIAGAVGMTDSTAAPDIMSAPAIVPAEDVPADAPPIWPFLFITIACGAVSGFHGLVGSGTTSKQIASEPDAQMVGYGSMLMEGALAVLVILACCAGVGMGMHERTANESGVGVVYVPRMTDDGSDILRGRDAWETRYDTEKGWSGFGLGPKVGAFIEGGANFVGALGIPLEAGVGILAVMVACFAATTLDTATRLQRYVVQELATPLYLPLLKNKYIATLVAVLVGGVVAMIPGAAGPGSGGLILWPVFGALNQLLAGLTFILLIVWFIRYKRPYRFIVVPALLMLLLPIQALWWQMFNPVSGWWGAAGSGTNNFLLFSLGAAGIVLQIWFVIEAVRACRRPMIEK